MSIPSRNTLSENRVIVIGVIIFDMFISPMLDSKHNKGTQGLDQRHGTFLISLKEKQYDNATSARNGSINTKQ